VKRVLLVLQEPAKMVVLTAVSGLRKSEIRGLRWEESGKELSVNRSIWNSEVNEPKTMRSKAPIPVVKQLAYAVEEHRQRMGKLAVGPIFQAGNGKPLNLDNLVRREIIPAIGGAGVEWHGWHAFRRGLATTLHQLRVDDKTIQAILRRSNVGITMNIYVKSVAESQVSAMDALGANMQNGPACNDLATKNKELIN